MSNEAFKELVWRRGNELYRDMPWRSNTDPYYVLVSELMLQQTQVERVIPKFNAFIKRFPDVFELSSASLADVLTLWSGLGYNRRAKFLHEAARKIVTDYNGAVPTDVDQLMSLPGVGPNTAAAVLVYGFNEAVGFIETNIRTVYFQHFFENSAVVTDTELRAFVSQTIDPEHPREWFWALMDYGFYLKGQGAGQLTKSAHYKKQSPLKGSNREVRGQIVRLLTKGNMLESELRQALQADERFDPALQALIKEGMIDISRGKLHLTK